MPSAVSSYLFFANLVFAWFRGQRNWSQPTQARNKEKKDEDRDGDGQGGGEAASIGRWWEDSPDRRAHQETQHHGGGEDQQQQGNWDHPEFHRWGERCGQRPGTGPAGQSAQCPGTRQQRHPTGSNQPDVEQQPESYHGVRPEGQRQPRRDRRWRHQCDRRYGMIWLRILCVSEKFITPRFLGF